MLAKCKRRTGSFGTSVKANRTLRLLDLAEHALQTFRTCRDVWFTAVDNVLANSYKLIQIQNHIGEGVFKKAATAPEIDLTIKSGRQNPTCRVVNDDS